MGEMARERSVVARRVEAPGDNTFARVLADQLGALGGELASRGAGHLAPGETGAAAESA